MFFTCSKLPFVRHRLFSHIWSASEQKIRKKMPFLELFWKETGWRKKIQFHTDIHSSRTDDVTSTFGSICLNNIFGISRSWWLTWCWVLNPETTPQIQFCRTSTCLPRILATPSSNFIEFARKMTRTAGFVYIMTNFCQTKFLSQSEL